MDKYLIEKEIEYLSQLQEKEKFKLDVIRNTLQNSLFCVVAFWVGLFSIAIMVTIAGRGGITRWIFMITGSFPLVIWLIYFIFENYKMGKIEKDIQRIEKKIKEKYKQLGVNVDDLK